MKTRYITTTETAKIIRKTLKSEFPGIKFSVRSRKYAGGSSINISYNDINLNSREVDKVTDKFSAGDFDGMTDSYNYRNDAIYEGEKVSFSPQFIFASNYAV